MALEGAQQTAARRVPELDRLVRRPPTRCGRRPARTGRNRPAKNDRAAERVARPRAICSFSPRAISSAREWEAPRIDSRPATLEAPPTSFSPVPSKARRGSLAIIPASVSGLVCASMIAAKASSDAAVPGPRSAPCTRARGRRVRAPRRNRPASGRDRRSGRARRRAPGLLLIASSSGRSARNSGRNARVKTLLGSASASESRSIALWPSPAE